MNNDKKISKVKWAYSPENSDVVYNKKDIVKLTKGNLQYAKLVMDRLTWESPETLIQEDLNHGEIVEFNNQYIITGGEEIEINIL